MAVRLPAELLTLIDGRAAANARSRAATIRDLLTQALYSGRDDGVDRGQIRRMLAMTPAERVRQMTEVANAQTHLRRRARKGDT